jgi:SNF2 family DNA or RNA helicase
MSTRLQQITSNMGSLPKGEKEFHKRCSIKEDLLVELIQQGDIETPLLVWTWFVETTQAVKERLEKEFKDLRISSVHGAMKAEAKDDAIDAYKDGELDVLVLQMGVGKFGHTFTDTKTVFYHDRSFDSDAWVQSLRRVRRIGLKHRPVLLIPKIENSIDELIDANLAGKLTSIAKMTKSDLAALLKSLGDMEFEDDSTFAA